MTPEAKQRIQLFLVVAIVVAAGRAGWIFYQRHQENVQEAKKEQAPPLNPDYYVTPRKLYPYDLKSMQQLAQAPVWMKVGYAVDYVAFRGGHAEFSHSAGTFTPLEKLQIEKVVKDGDQLAAVFTKDGKQYAFSVGQVVNDQYNYAGNDMLYYDDPHQMYTHWPAEMWQAIDQHQVTKGMNELQAGMAIGLGVPQSGGSFGNRTINYPNGGHPVAVTFANGKAVEISNVSA
jgi:hypothetical protein